MDATIQEMLDHVSANGFVQLPNGEFEGPFVVRIPCTIQGNSTTLWADAGPVMIMEAEAECVFLKHLRIEITGATNDFQRVAVENNSPNLYMENVEVDGDVLGYAGENNWLLPKSVHVGAFAAEQTNTFTMKIWNDSDAEVISNIDGLTVSPSYVNRGLNTITLTTDRIRDRMCLYGEILIQSAFIRRIYVSGRAQSGAAIADGHAIFDAEASPLFLENHSCLRLSEPIATAQVNNQHHIPDGDPHRLEVVSQVTVPLTPGVSAEPVISEKIELQRGQRESLSRGVDDVRLRFVHQTRNATVDTYAFQLMGNDRVASDEGLIFFGNDRSADGSVQLTPISNGDEFALRLTQTPSHIEKIRFVCSVYCDEHEHKDFSSVENTDIYIIVDSKEYHCRVNDVHTGPSMVAMEIYLYKSEWKIRVITSGIHKPIAEICGDYGVAVE